jgi:hypothetical protein
MVIYNLFRADKVPPYLGVICSKIALKVGNTERGKNYLAMINLERGLSQWKISY